MIRVEAWRSIRQGVKDACRRLLTFALLVVLVTRGWQTTPTLFDDYTIGRQSNYYGFASLLLLSLLLGTMTTGVAGRFTATTK